MKSGNSFATSRKICLKEFLDDKTLNEINKSNNILAIEYLKAIKRINNNIIIPYTIKREGNDFSDTTLNLDTNFISATSIRETIYKKNTSNINILKKYVPNETFKLIDSIAVISNEDLFHVIKYNIIQNLNNLSNFNGVIEGLENRIIHSLNISKTYDEFIHNIKSKRYTMSSIKRLLLNILLNIKKVDFDELNKNNLNYAHILSISDKGKILLSEISKKSDVNILTSINNKTLLSLNNICKKSLQLDILATNIYYSLLNKKINKDYTNKL